MRKVFKKKSAPLTVTYGLKPKDVIPLVTHIDSCVVIDTGWMSLTIGWDGNGKEVVFAVCGNDTFLLSAVSPIGVALPEGQTCVDWVHAVNGLPDDFYAARPISTRIAYCGFHVEYGHDFAGRDFFFIGMPNGELNLLFRKPTPPLTKVWSERPATSLHHTMVVGPHKSAGDLAFDEIDDDDLEALLTGTA
jgi:hypothetical protein